MQLRFIPLALLFTTAFTPLEKETCKNRGMDREAERLEQARHVLSFVTLALLLAGIYLVFRPFLVPIAWAAILVLGTWPVHSKILSFMPRYPNLAAGAATLLLAVLLLAAAIPLATAIARQVDAVGEAVVAFLSKDEISLPRGVKRLPLVGPLIEEKFSELRAESHEIITFLSSYRTEIVRAATVAAKGVIGFLLKLFIFLLTAFFLYRHGSTLERQVQVAAVRLGGERFTRLLSAIMASVKGSFYGVLATALIQGVLAGLGYLVAGAPVPLLLGLATTMVSLVPFGPPLIYLPVAAYLCISGHWITGLLLAAWGVGVVSTADNFLRPYFISQTSRTPILLVFFGVIGGLTSFGMLGVFLGPAILAVAHVLWREWVNPAGFGLPSRADDTTTSHGL